MTGYVRNDTSNNIATGNVINASDLDGEFDAIVNAFNASTGHTHDGTAAEGAAITKVGPSQALEVTASALVPKTDNTLDLGTSSYEFKDLYIDGTANIDSLVADTADINGGTIDGVTITTPRITTGLLDTNGNEIVLFTATASAVNEVTVTNAAATGTPSIAATGTDTNISLNLVSKGTGTVNINGAAALFSGGALGTPSSGTLTNATGLPIDGGTINTLPVSRGGTGQTTYSAADILVGNSSNSLSKAALTAGTGINISINLTGPNSVTVSVPTNAITDALLRQSAGLSLIGRSANTTGNVADITAATDNQVLRRSGTAIGFGAVNLASTDAVTGSLAVTNGGTGGTSQSTARTGLGATTIGSNLFTLTNPSAVTFPRFNADNTVSSLSAADFRTAIGAGTGTGTVTSVGGTGSVNGITLTGTVTSSGNLTLGGSLSNVSLSTQVTGTLPLANGGTGQTTAQAAINSLAGAVTSGQYLRGNGTNVVMSGIQAGDVPTLNQNTTGSAATLTTSRTFQTNLASTSAASFNGSANVTPGVTGTLAVANGGTGVTTSTGSGSNVLSTSPTLVTPILGTPTSGNLSNCTVDGTDAVGFRNTPINSQSAAYTAVLADSGKTILHPISDNNARTFTIPANSSVAYPVGTVLTFVNLINTVTIAITSDTMYLAGPGTTGSRTLAAYGVATAVKVTSTSWIISGNGLT